MQQPTIVEDDIDALPDVIDIHHPHAMRLQVINDKGEHVLNVLEYNRKTKGAVIVGDMPYYDKDKYHDAITKMEGNLPRKTVTLENTTLRYNPNHPKK